MWPILDSVLRYCAHKKWPLPVLGVLLFLSLTIYVDSRGFFDLPHQVPVTETVIQVIPTPLPEKVIPVLPSKPKETSKKAPKRHEEIKVADQEDEAPSRPVWSNVERARHLAEDYLRDEGIDSDTAHKIFQKMDQDRQTERTTPYDLSDSVRSVIGGDDDDRVYRISDLILKAGKETLYR